ncbi:hypothetical protein CAEBREN_28910 [Caenorhabditis brenneri]|uniref:Uncharacterized protein n=1 Tax=Caenorhabditis brenneri TaxID=135651 RepID=G0MKP9_CAEBE|nr:hypothetical protein CAEBREN_28910 [Caenorhabditis brenneri]
MHSIGIMMKEEKKKQTETSWEN